MEDQYGDSSYSRQWSNTGPIQCEMVRPILPSRIEKGNKLPSLPIHRAYFAALKPVTVKTSPRQVLVTFSTTMLARDNVIGFVALDSVILVEMTILTAVSGSLGNSQALRGGNGHDVVG